MYYISLYGIVIKELPKFTKPAILFNDLRDTEEGYNSRHYIKTESLEDTVLISKLIADKWSNIGWYVDLNIISEIANHLRVVDEKDANKYEVMKNNEKTLNIINKVVKPKVIQLKLW